MKIKKFTPSGILIQEDDSDIGFADVLNFENLIVTDEGNKITVNNIKHFGAPVVIVFYSTAANVANTYTYFGGGYSNKTGFICMHSGKISGIAYMNYYPNTSSQAGFISIRKNETYTEIAKMDITNGAQKEYTILPTGSLNFAAGDWLSCYVSGGKLSKPVIAIEFEWTD